MTLISDLHQQWLKDPEYQAAYEAQRPEFETEDLTDWKRVKEMTSEEIEANAQADPDCQPTDDDFWADAKVVKPSNHKVSS